MCDFVRSRVQSTSFVTFTVFLWTHFTDDSDQRNCLTHIFVGIFPLFLLLLLLLLLLPLLQTAASRNTLVFISQPLNVIGDICQLVINTVDRIHGIQSTHVGPKACRAYRWQIHREYKWKTLWTWLSRKSSTPSIETAKHPPCTLHTIPFIHFDWLTSSCARANANVRLKITGHYYSSEPSWYFIAAYVWNEMERRPCVRYSTYNIMM